MVTQGISVKITQFILHMLIGRLYTFTRKVDELETQLVTVTPPGYSKPRLRGRNIICRRTPFSPRFEQLDMSILTIVFTLVRSSNTYRCDLTRES